MTGWLRQAPETGVAPALRTGPAAGLGAWAGRAGQSLGRGLARCGETVSGTPASASRPRAPLTPGDRSPGNDVAPLTTSQPSALLVGLAQRVDRSEEDR
jgi:hypothetical protein